MNIFIGSGRVSDVSLVKEGEILKFLLVIDGKGNNGKNAIPCTIFKPSPEIKESLAQEPAVELIGWVRNYVFENSGTSKTEIIVNLKSLKVLDT